MIGVIEEAISLIDEQIDFSGIYDGEQNRRVATVILVALREMAERKQKSEYSEVDAKRKSE